MRNESFNDDQHPAGSPESNHLALNRSLLGLLAVALFLLSFAIYLPTAKHGFVNYDDPQYVSENPQVIAGMTAHTVSWALTTNHAGNWHPLTWLSHMLDVELFGLRPGGHHLTSVLLHSLNTVLLFVFLFTATRSLWRSAMVAALFALHPTHVESVAWISERKDVLSTLFGIGCLIAYTLYARNGKRALTDAAARQSPVCWRNVSYLVSLLCLALGLMAKPMLVTLPCVLLLLDYWPLERLKNEPKKRIIIEKLPFLAITAASCVITFVVQRQGGAVQNLRELSLLGRIENAIVSYARYAGKAFWPTNLATPYPHPGDWPTMLVLGCLAGLLIITSIAWFNRRRFPFLLMGWLWFLGTLVPVIGLVQVGSQAMADRYTYLPYIGLFVAAVWTVTKFLPLERPKVTAEIPQTVSREEKTAACQITAQTKWLAAFAAILILLPLAWATNRQNQVWHDSETLFRHSISVTKSNWIAYYNLGWHLDKQGRLEEALKCYRKAVEIDPKFPDPMNNIGCALAALKKYEEAIPCFEATLQLQPSFLEAHVNVANALRELGRNEEAIARYQLVLEKNSDHRAALNHLGTLLAGKTRFADAILLFQRSLTLDPKQPAIHYALANALARSRRLPEALDHYQQALAGTSDSANIRTDYGLCLARMGRLDEAAQVLREAVLKYPAEIKTRLTLGGVLANQQKSDQAISLFREVLTLSPDNAEAHANLGPLLAMQGDLDAAIAHLTAALKTRPNDPIAHMNLGRALASKGKKEDAVNHFREVLRLKADYLPARAELQALGIAP